MKPQNQSRGFWNCSAVIIGGRWPPNETADSPLFLSGLILRSNSVAWPPNETADRRVSLKLNETTSLWFGPLYICHFVIRSLTRVDIQASYLGYFSREEKYTKNSFLISQTLFHDHQSSSSIIIDHLAWILHHTLLGKFFTNILHILCLS